MASHPRETHAPVAQSGAPHKPPDLPPVKELEKKPPEDHGELSTTELHDPSQIVDEQRQRSEEIQREGVIKWVQAHDDRPKDEQPELGKDGYLHNKPGASKQVPGITHPTTDKVSSK